MRPLRALLHPLWLAAFLVLVINDHVLKAYAPEPRWLIGKASDLAGLIVLPPVVAALVGARSRRGLLVVWAAVGVGFALIKAVPAASALYLDLLWFLDGANVVDPTDLIALAVLPPGLVVLGAAMTRPVPVCRAHRVALIGGAVASIATPAKHVPPQPCPAGSFGAYARNDRCEEAFAAPGFIGNTGGQTVTIEVRTLRDDTALTCAEVEQKVRAGDGCLDEALFGPAQRITLRRAENVPLPGGRDTCSVALIAIDPVRPAAIVVFPWNGDQAPIEAVPYVTPPDQYSSPQLTGVMISADVGGITATAPIALAPLVCPEVP